MKIIEQKKVGKTTLGACEDGIVVTDDFIAVVDGSTSKAKLKIADDISNGRYCMQLVCKLIEKMPFDTSLDEFCSSITDIVYKAYEESNCNMTLLKENPAERMAASTVIFSRHFRQIWMIGDCQCMIGGQLVINPKPQESVIAQKRAKIIHQAIAKGASIDDIRYNDIGREAIIDDLRHACAGQNKNYSVIDGFEILRSGIKTINIGSEKSEVVLASDGYPNLYPTLEKSEAELKNLLLTDPLCIGENIATKGLALGAVSFDDRSYIRFVC